MFTKKSLGNEIGIFSKAFHENEMFSMKRNFGKSLNLPGGPSKPINPFSPRSPFCPFGPRLPSFPIGPLGPNGPSGPKVNEKKNL